ncbi:hypothetical protein GCM10025751_48670 [Haladaptatus pallidirubidus]|uniref:Gfo/Idh/MocA-like oxidoreductase N-terminal domain-containing protein n=2 Tax=Haladaptatus pallidirubidus TaxID=1008152 RepID=A0AAV3UPC3_9EURY
MGILGMHKQEEIGTKKVKASHAGGYAETPNIELVAISDIDEDNLRKFGDAWNIPIDRQYVGHDSMLSSEDLDVVSVCTPSYLHHEHVIDAAQSTADPGVIWCEKPIASQVTEAEEMISVCAETNTELLVNHSFRFTKKLRQLRYLIQEEELLGDIRSVSAQFRMELLRNSTHVLDTLTFLLDTKPKEVSGYINGENEAIDSLGASKEVDDAGGGGFIIMKDGAFVNIDCTVPREFSSMCFQFTGTEGKLYMNNDDGEWRYWKLEDGTHVEQPIPGIEDAWTWDDDYRSAFPNAAEHIIELLDGSADNHSSGKVAAKSLEIIVGFYLSHYTDGRATFPLDRPLCDVSITSW